MRILNFSILWRKQSAIEPFEIIFEKGSSKESLRKKDELQNFLTVGGFSIFLVSGS